MGRIKKAAGLKHEATVSPAIADFVLKAISIPISRLPKHLETFPRRWPFPRGDLYHWIPLLNRFDNTLDQFIQEYGLNVGPQIKPFGRKLLVRGVAGESKGAPTTGASTEALVALDFSSDGDRELIDSILVFSRMLLENCGNRSLYNSSDRLGDILNTTNLSLLANTLQVAVRLAQRYHASRQRGANAGQHLNAALLASHYNIDLDKVQKLANPFVKLVPLSSTIPEFSPITPTTPTLKGKEKAQTAQTNSTPTSDMLAMAKDEDNLTNGSNKRDKTKERTGHCTWEDWGAVLLRYYQTPTITKGDKEQTAGVTSASPYTSPSVRRPSGLSRPSRLPSSDDLPESPSIPPPTKPDDSASGGMQTIKIPYATISSLSIEEIIGSELAGLPKEYHYELLTKVRAASAISASLATRQQMLSIRLLAITNLAYIYPENTFQQKILQQDSDEPRRLQLAYQLTDLVHPPGNRGSIPITLQTVAMGALEALAKHKAKAPDVCTALNINVNHGVLFYALRKAVTDLTVDDFNDEGTEGDEWREALFSLLDTLPASTPRTGETLIATGLLDILIEMLTLRTIKAERCFPKVLAFLNTIIYSVRDAFQTLANSKGLDTISDLIAYEVQSSLERARKGEGLPQNVRNQVIDYQIPFFQQQTLRWLFKFVNHMMSHGNGNFDRLLRNLIDSSQLLIGLQTVIVNAKIFGSSVWSGAVNIMSAFIHNEPTSYAVIAEAGLSRGLLDAITSEVGSGPGEPTSDSQHLASLQALVASDQINAEAVEERFTPEKVEARVQLSEKNLLAQGILPATDAIVTIPQAFGAICLNNTGMELFMNSVALDKFFEIFESPDHVRSMNIEGELARLLGSSFDELVRHHPRLRQLVMISVMAMVQRVAYLCRSRATNRGLGAKLFLEGKNGELLDSADLTGVAEQDNAVQTSHQNQNSTEGDEDVAMTDATYEDREAGLISKVDTTAERDDENTGPSTSTYINVAMKFLAGFFENSALCTAFIEQGGTEFVLDFATLPSLQYDFNNQAASQEIARVVHMLAEQKPHLVLPSLVKRTQNAVSELDPLSNHSDGSAFFSDFTSTDRELPSGFEANPKAKVSVNGTLLAKSLVHVHTLCNILYETFSLPIYNSRSSHTFFSQVNLADMYKTLIRSLGRLHRACVWEEILLQKSIPDTWREATKIKGYGMGSEEADEIFGFINRNENRTGTSDDDDFIPEALTADIFAQPGSIGNFVPPKKIRKASLSKDEKSAQFKNVRVLRYLLSQIPSSIIPFFQGLGKALVAKRRPDAYARQNAYMVAVAMSHANLDQLNFDAPRNSSSIKDRYAYWIVILTSISQLIIEGPVDRPHSQCLTLVLQAFKDGGGLDAIQELLEIFLEEAKSVSSPSHPANMDDGERLNSCYGGIKIILNFYSQITNSKPITEAAQTIALTSNDRDRGHMHFFSPSQFLVELRMAVLPVVKSIWESDFMDVTLESIVKCVMEILRTILEGGEELGSFKRGDKFPSRGKTPLRIYPLRLENIAFLTDKGNDQELAREALYRCMNVQNAADEYCRAQKTFSKMSRNPIPSYDQEKPKTPSPTQTPHRQDSEATIPDPEHGGQSDETSRATEIASVVESLVQTESHADDLDENARGDTAAGSIPPPPPAPGVPAEIREGLDGMNFDNLLNLTQMLGSDQVVTQAPSRSDNTSPSSAQTSIAEAAKPRDVVTVNDLDDERATIRRTLIDRAMDVLNVHDGITFELSDLINAAASKATEAITMRREIGETLVQSLISFQMNEDFRSEGKKIAAYANLLALVLQDREFYDATLEELQTNFCQLLSYIKIFPEQPAEEASPWISQVLLIIEKILAEDVQPSKIQWTPPSPNDSKSDGPIAELESSLIPMDEKTQLFKAILDILPHIGKDEILVLSVIRTLVILTRNREIASTLGDKRNIQRLFVMIKQLAGITNDKVQSTFMLLLRHIVEDEDTIRQIMRSEIIANFETRTNRATDTNGYVRQMYHLVLRSPTTFVEVTNEKLEIPKYDPNQSAQVLMLKPEILATADIKESTSSPVESSADSIKEMNDQVHDEVKPLDAEDGKSTTQKAKTTEIKSPVVERPSGVIHYLLYELLSYKDVEDKDHPLPTKQLAEEHSSSTTIDLSLANGSETTFPIQLMSVEGSDLSKPEKPEFKAEQHPIYIYRCFILQCLAELLHCYNHAKIEFINFSRKADPKAMTPSKPRSGVLNYLLNDVIPVGTLNHEESIAFRKRSSTSNWAMSAIVSLCLKTNENGYDKKRGSIDEEDESDLLFVRKFVLEHALKAYKDANSSDESLDVKYARLLSIADLFQRMLIGKLVHSPTAHSDPSANTQKVIAKLMFEKSFISALTSSIADIDLNFPAAKRAVKYILRPLKQLTATAIVLSETSSISSNPSHTDDDEISTASSVSQVEDEREETPDLFRNSTLGMFEPGREEESSSESSDADEDEEMYDEYEEDAYAEEMERDADEVISDEEEIDGAGPIEGMPGNTGMDVEVVIDDDDDELSDEDEDEDEDEDDSDEMDEDDDVVQVIDEITSSSENDSLAGDEEGEWQDDDGDGDHHHHHHHEENGLEHNLSQDQDAESAVRDIVREFGGAEAALQRLESAEFGADLEGYMDDVVRVNDEEDVEEDDDEEDAEDEEIMYQPGYEDEEPGIPDPPWGWEPDDDEGMPLTRGHHHHHHHARRIPSPWTIFPTGGPGDRIPTYRSHRPSGVPRNADDGVNPLLQRNDRVLGMLSSARSGRSALSEAAASMSDYWVHGMESGPGHRSLVSADGPVSFVNNILAAIGQGGSGFATMGGPHGALHFHVAGGARGFIPRELQAVLGLRQPIPESSRANRDEPIAFLPAPTFQRWQEEARILFGNAHTEKAQRVINSLLRMLVPPAMEKEKKRQEDLIRQANEENEKLEAARLAKEKAAQEALEKEQEAAREVAAEADAASALANGGEVEGEIEHRDEASMEGVETTHTEESASTLSNNAEGPTSVEEPAASSSEPTERVRTTIRGRDLDITGMGVDLEYLDALPEDLREEVLMHQLALQRSQAAAAGEEPTDISREFLEALPPDIREELLQQEAQDRRRREREEDRRRRTTANSGGASRGEDMDPASFLASLDPTFRQTVLMEQDEEVLAQLPQAIAAEARALGGDRIMGRFGDMPRIERGRGVRHTIRDAQQITKKPQRRQIVQMLDKAGVATLLRLMFIPQVGSSRLSLNGILHDVSQNKQNRAEVVSLLLSILQDGSADVNAVERSFTHLSLRAKPPVVQKTPTLKRALTGQMTSLNNTEMTPLMVIQQCLSALVSLTQYNPQISFFFLMEHDISSGLKSKSNRKGKGKETKASKYALNALLSLLDRKLIMESSSCMEQLASLLQSITHPLNMLLRKEKEKPEDAKIVEVPSNEVNADDPSTEENAPITHEDQQPTPTIEMPDVQMDVTQTPLTENDQPVSGGAIGSETMPEEIKKPEEEEKSKKPRTLTTPVVPEENLRLVVNILAARECSAKTFRDTLSTINNLSAIPEAKEIFGKGLIEQAQDLGQAILSDLDELVPQIQQAESGTDIQGMALAKFSPASSDQAKLLRVLTALDYLFDPKRNGGKIKPVIDDKEKPGEGSQLKEDLLTALYENSTFGPLWAKLSECLSVIRQGEGMLNIATILLPLIEALMVVCKNTTLKDNALLKAVKEFAVTSPPPESRMETLFFRFTEDHRKILNDLVRHTPKLMSGTFSLLVKNPKVLEFDNKRNYFTRRLHSRGTEARHPQPPLQLSVRRDQVFLDSFKFLSFKSGDEIKYGKLSIRFHGEEGVDAGGVTREWFQVLSRQMFNPNYALFIPVASDRTTFHPNKLSKINEEHLLFFKFIGRIIGKALYEGRALDCHFSRAVYKRILGKTVSIKDMETLDLEYYKSLLWMLENDVTDIITETFSIETNVFGETKIVDLIENGRNVPVTEENKQEYVQLVVEYKLTGSVQTQLEHFLRGFHDIVPAELISIFNEQELELLISGLPDIDVDDWKNNTEYHNYSASSSQIQWFWRAVRSFDKEERAKLLQFVTGTSKVPLNGFSQLEGMNGFSRFNIHRDYGNKDRLPSSHTCFNQLDLPEYDSYEILRQQLYTAMTAGSEYFGFA